MSADAALVAMFVIVASNLVGWAFTIGIIWQKTNGMEKRQDRHEELPGTRAHPPNGKHD